MLKKLFIFVLSFSFIIGYSFAGDITDALTGAISAGSNKFVLNNGKNTINNREAASPYIFEFKKGDNSFLDNNISNYYDPIHITCKNGYITELSGNHLWNGQQPSANLYYFKESTNGNIILTCKPIAKPVEKLEDTNIDYQTIREKSAWKAPFSVTTNKPDISSDDIKKFENQKDVDNQPSFTDIVYLQLELISNLSDSLINTKADFDFSALFQTQQDFQNYNAWLDKFGNYTNKKDFIDAMSGAITLKDVGVAQDVIKGLYDCALNNNCNGSINFQYNIFDKYQIYSLKDIQDTFYKKLNDNILYDAINYYDNLSKTCNNISSIQDDFLRVQTQNICNEILKQSVDDTNQQDLDNYNLGYGLGQRVKNLNKLKTSFTTLGTGVNLLGVYNTYYELTNLNVGLNKLSDIKKAIKTNDTDKQYESIRKIFEKDKNIAQKKAIGSKKIFEIDTIIKGISTGNTLYNNIKNTNVNLLKDVKVNGENISQFVGSFSGITYVVKDTFKVRHTNISYYINISNNDGYKYIVISGSKYYKIGYNWTTKKLYIKKNLKKFASRRWLSKVYLKANDLNNLSGSLNSISSNCSDKRKKIKCLKKGLKNTNLISFIMKNKGDYYKLKIKKCSDITDENICSASNKCEWDSGSCKKQE